MDTALAFIAAIWAQFLRQDALTQLTTVVTFVGSPTAIALAATRAAYRSMLSRERRVAEKQAELVAEQAGRIKELEAENAALLTHAPSGWLRNAERERRDGNEERAILLLRNGLDSAASDIAEVCLDLAGHHLAFSDDELQSHLPVAERYVRLAMLLTPDDRRMRSVADEVQELKAAHEVESVLFQVGTDSAEDFLDPDPGSDAPSTIKALITAVERTRFSGHFRRAMRLARRAELIARRHLGSLDSLTLTAGFYHAQMLLFDGDAPGALQKLDDIILFEERVLGGEHPETLATRGQRADVLRALGRHREALDELDHLLPVQKHVFGDEHPSTLSICHMRSQALAGLGQHREALYALDRLLPVRERVIGAEHPNTLTARYLRASVLASLGRHQEALDEMDQLVPIRERISGCEHPDTLSNYFLRARLLASLGRHQEALHALEHLLPLEERIRGSEHDQTLATRHMRARALDGLGRHQEALDELNRLLPIEDRVRGGEHSRTLRTLWLRGKVLASLGRKVEAVELLTLALAGQERALPTDHPHVTETRTLLEQLGRGPVSG